MITFYTKERKYGTVAVRFVLEEESIKVSTVALKIAE